MMTFDHAEAWRLWNTGQFASRVELANHLGTSRQTLTQSLQLYGFKVPPRKEPSTTHGPNCTVCGKAIPRREAEACSDWRKRKRCMPCREAKLRPSERSHADHVREPQHERYSDPGLLIERLQEVSEHPRTVLEDGSLGPGPDELTWESMDKFIGVRRCERPVMKVWFGDARA